MKPYIVAELGASHRGGLKEAYALVDAAIAAGADAVKLQTWSPGTMCLDKSYTIQDGAWIGRNLHDLYAEAFLSWEHQEKVFQYCREKGIECFSSPFDLASVDFLESLGCPRYKIASFELIDYELIRYVATKGKPIILSTGMARPEEIMQAVLAAGGCDLTLLVCTSEYPASIADAPLHDLAHFAEIYKCKVGISDHTQGVVVPVAATALQVAMIEKHLCLSHADGGLDAVFSLAPQAFKAMVDSCDAISQAMAPKGINRKSAPLRRSLHAARNLVKGQTITYDDICTARPATGLHPIVHRTICGKTMAIDVAQGQPITRGDVAW